MRKLVMLSAVAILAFGVVGTASARPLNWDGSLLIELGDLPALGNTGGGVATVNGSAGPIPAQATSSLLTVATAYQSA